jgi:hypothetical protein
MIMEGSPQRTRREGRWSWEEERSKRESRVDKLWTICAWSSWAVRENDANRRQGRVGCVLSSVARRSTGGKAGKVGVGWRRDVDHVVRRKGMSGACPGSSEIQMQLAEAGLGDDVGLVG